MYLAKRCKLILNTVRTLLHKSDSLGLRPHLDYSIESGLDVGQEINIGSGKFGKNNKRMALN